MRENINNKFVMLPHAGGEGDIPYLGSLGGRHNGLEGTAHESEVVKRPYMPT